MQHAIIGGFTESKGRRKHFGALVLGIRKGGTLIYIGHVGVGFDREGLAELKKKLMLLKQKESPFIDPPRTNAPVSWVKPVLEAEVAFSEWTKTGKMRHPVFLCLRRKYR